VGLALFSGGEAMGTKDVFYICPVCFQTCDNKIECHAHMMIACDTGKPGDERRKPVKNRFGRYVSRAPLWFIESVGRLETK
jgi:hypothetical protein